MFGLFAKKPARARVSPAVWPAAWPAAPATFSLHVTGEGAPPATSHVDVASLEKAVARLAAAEAGSVRLGRSVPAPTPAGLCHAVEAARTPDGPFTLFAYFQNEEGRHTFRLARAGTQAAAATAALAAFLTRSALPEDIATWEEQRAVPALRLHQSLFVDGEEEPAPDWDDVAAAFEMVGEGQAASLMLMVTGDVFAYLEAASDDGREWRLEVLADDPQGVQRGFRRVTPWRGHVRAWLADFFHDGRLPAITDDWQPFDVKRHFAHLAKKIAKTSS